MALSFAKIMMVQASMVRLAARPDISGLVFYHSLVRQAPALTRLGRPDDLAQARAVVARLVRIVALLDQPERLRANLVDLAQRLRAAGVTPRDYRAIHAALGDMVAGDIARNGDALAEEAWGDAIDLILHTMLCAAHGLRPSAQPSSAPLAA